MNILNKTMQAVRDFDSAIRAAREEFEATKQQIMDTYANKVKSEKLAEAREALTAIEIRETANARKIVEADFAEARNAVFEFVAKSVPDDFPATLAAIQAKGMNITEYEAASFLKKYEDNYTAYSSILNVLNGNSPLLEALAGNSRIRGVYVLKPDTVDEDVEGIEKRILNWIQNRTSGAFESEYYSRLFTKETGNPIQALANRIENYIAGGFIIDNSQIIPSYEASPVSENN